MVVFVVFWVVIFFTFFDEMRAKGPKGEFWTILIRGDLSLWDQGVPR